ncbi:MAG: hypothetical protein WCO58_03340 [bacterium]
MKKTVTIFIIVSSVTIAVLFGDFLFWKKINDNKKEIAVINNEIQNRYKNDTVVNKMRRLVSSAQDDQQLLAGHFLRKSQTIDFLNSLEDLGTTAGVTASINDVTVGKDAKSLNVSISANGSYQNLYNYFFLLEQLPYYITVTNLSATSEGVKIDPVTKVSAGIVWDGAISFTINSYSDTD